MFFIILILFFLSPLYGYQIVWQKTISTTTQSTIAIEGVIENDKLYVCGYSNLKRGFIFGYDAQLGIEIIEALYPENLFFGISTSTDTLYLYLSGKYYSLPSLFVINSKTRNIEKIYSPPWGIAFDKSYFIKNYFHNTFVYSADTEYFKGSYMVGYHRFDSQGNLLNKFQIEDYDFVRIPFDIKVSSLNEVFIVGSEKTTLPTADNEILILKVTASTYSIKTVDFNNLNDIGCSLYLTKNSELYVAGLVTTSSSPFQINLWVMKFNRNLTPIWSQPYLKPLACNPTGFSSFLNELPFFQFCDIYVDETTNDIYITCNLIGHTTTFFDVSSSTGYLLIIDENKNPKYEMAFNRSILTSICLDSQKNIYLTGASYVNNLTLAAIWKLSEISSLNGVLCGYVKDENNVPLSGTTIEVYKNNIFVASTTTDAQGYYSFLLPEDSYLVKASSNGYISKSLNVFVKKSSTTTLDFVLEKVNFGFLSGTILNEEGQLVAGALISAIQNQVVVSSSVSQSDGSYFMTLDAGSYDIKVEAFGYQTQISTSILILPAETTTKNFVLKRISFGFLQGTVVSTKAEPIESAKITVFKDSLVITSTFTNKSGNYFLSLPTGTYLIEASSLGFVSASTTTTILTNTTTTVNFVLKEIPKGIIKGVVIDKDTNQPLPSVLVRLFEGQQLLLSTNTSTNGQFIFIVSPSTYSLKFSLEGYITTTYYSIKVKDEETVTLNIYLEKEKFGVIMGIVVDLETNQPIGNAMLRLYRYETLISSTITDINGNYKFICQIGSYTIEATALGYEKQIREIFITEKSTTTLNFTLTPLYYIEGYITTASQQALSNVTVFLLNLTEGTTIQAQTNSDGYYKFSNLKKANYILYPHKENWSFQPQKYSYTPLNSNKTLQNFIATPLNIEEPHKEEYVQLPIGKILKPKKDEIKIVFADKSLGDKIYIVFATLPNKEYKVKIFTSLGTQVYNTTKRALFDYEYIEYDTKDIPSGTYIITIEEDKLKTTKKFSISK